MRGGRGRGRARWMGSIECTDYVCTPGLITRGMMCAVQCVCGAMCVWCNVCVKTIVTIESTD